jgi:hypothetical protein
MASTAGSEKNAKPDRDPQQERIIEENRAAQKHVDAAGEEIDAFVRKSIQDHGA